MQRLIVIDERIFLARLLRLFPGGQFSANLGRTFFPAILFRLRDFSVLSCS